MKKILICLPNLNGGGAERVCVNIANQLSAEGNDVTLVISQQSGVYFNQVSPTIPILCLNCRKTSFSIFKLLAVVKKLSPEVVISSTHRMNTQVALLRFISRCKFILYLRLPNSPRLEVKNGILPPWKLFFYSLVYKRANYVVSQSYEMEEEASIYLSIKKNKVKTLINPLDINNIHTQTEGSKSPYSENRINFVAAGRLHYQKGFDILIRSFADVIKSNPLMTLYIIGKDVGEEGKLKKIVEEFGLTNNVHFLGFKENPYVYFKHADCFILSSRWEGLPNAVLESLYLGTPVIATKCVKILNDLIIQGSNGYLVDIEDQSALSQAILNFSKLDNSSFYKPEIQKLSSFFN